MSEYRLSHVRLCQTNCVHLTAIACVEQMDSPPLEFQEPSSSKTKLVVAPRAARDISFSPGACTISFAICICNTFLDLWSILSTSWTAQTSLQQHIDLLAKSRMARNPPSGRSPGLSDGWCHGQKPRPIRWLGSNTNNQARTGSSRIRQMQAEFSARQNQLRSSCVRPDPT